MTTMATKMYHTRPRLYSTDSFTHEDLHAAFAASNRYPRKPDLNIKIAKNDDCSPAPPPSPIESHAPRYFGEQRLQS